MHQNEDTSRLLAEIRDLLREQGERQQQAMAIQKEAVANQLAAIRTQRQVLRVLVPLILGLALLLLLWVALGRRSRPLLGAGVVAAVPGDVAPR